MAFDGDAAGDMPEEDAVVGFVDFLPSVACTADEFFFEVVFPDAQFGHALFEGFEFFRSDHVGKGMRGTAPGGGVRRPEGEELRERGEVILRKHPDGGFP